jgi:hypothetical protein
LDATRTDRLLARSTFAGTTDEIVAGLHGIRDASPLPVEFAARSYFATLEYGAQVELMEELADGVAPHV